MKDLLGCVAFCASVVVIFWLYLFATPDQLSGESDWTAEAESEVAK